MAIAVSVLIGAVVGLSVYNWLFAEMGLRLREQIIRGLREDVQNIYVQIGYLSAQIAGPLDNTPETPVTPVRRGGL